MLNALILTVLLLSANTQGQQYDQRAAVAGSQSFRTYCASCHGTSGKGDGPLAEYMKVPPADLTTIAQRNDGEFPFQEVRRKIDGREDVAGHGTQEMPVWGDAFKTTDTEEQAQRRIEELAHFLWSIQVVSGE